ncbi:hypothetical protein CERZMDRAFT_97196 [Cercospora zeae-maydis SCOH1-5]|uniref:F-box domain-containing protein n=1 Tax=Cercospora zeae-maydis SCOH1-5 TaxID=717836 RepID=A0A6A6FH49_9PEZI|nr:hypothetical protein CERZMDRAFT_97196 [Cercospora zeae-maydis SCOH1-5]
MADKAPATQSQRQVSDGGSLQDAESDSDPAEVLFRGRGNAKSTLEKEAGSRARMLQITEFGEPPAGRQLEVHLCPSQPATAVMRVFGIRKLAERIFQDISPGELLSNAMRVCKQWRMTLSSSLELQRKLFLVPEEGPWARYVKPALHKGYFVEENNNSERIEIAINPFMTSRLRKDLEALEGYARPGRGASSAYLDLPKGRKKALLCEGASYCRMLAFQPPLVSLHFLEEQSTRDELDHIYDAWEVAKQEEGILIWDTVLRQELRYRYKRKPVELELFKKRK